MTRSHWSVFAAVVGVFLTAASAADKPKEIDIAGKYSCKGTNPDGSAYEGTVKISRSGDAYILEWVIGDLQHDGVGIRNGDLLSVGWKSAAESGIAVYKIEEAKEGVRLTGKWSANPGDGKLYPETLTREK